MTSCTRLSAGPVAEGASGARKLRSGGRTLGATHRRSADRGYQSGGGE
jgi:hypothetical protein